jgi:isocitrate/isopropylmalate dehydrogenase
LQLYANVRPVRTFPGTQSPLRNAKAGDIDWILVRENSEGEYGFPQTSLNSARNFG